MLTSKGRAGGKKGNSAKPAESYRRPEAESPMRPDVGAQAQFKRKGPPVHLILETKGLDLLEEVKRAAAERWVAAVNADGTYGRWKFGLVKRVSEINEILTRSASQKVNTGG